jgi:membrane-associated phospholipid phosphatase
MLVRLLLVVVFFAVAFAIDLLSDRRYSQILGSAAIFGSVFTLFPTIRPGLIAASAYALTWAGFNLVRAFADNAGLAIADPKTVSEIERWLFGGRLPSTILQDRVFDPGRVQVHDIALATVHGSFFIVPFLIAAITWWRRRALFHHYLLATALCFAASLVGFILLPTAPPWMSDPTDVTRITHQILNGTASGSGPVGSAMQDEAFWFEPNGLAALPSVHVAMAVLVFLELGRIARWGKVTGLLYALAMSVSVVYLGEHFVLDVISGWLVALAAWAIARHHNAPIP